MKQEPREPDYDPYSPPRDSSPSRSLRSNPRRNPVTGATGAPRSHQSPAKRLLDLLTPPLEDLSTADVRNQYKLLRRELCRTEHEITQVNNCSPTPSTCLVPFVVLTLYAHRSVKGSCRMPAGRNRWRAPVPPTSFWRRSSRSRGSPGNGKEWRKQSINGPWKRFVFAVCRSSRCLFEDRSRPVFVSSETNCAVRSVSSVYAVCTRPVQTGLCAK